MDVFEAIRRRRSVREYRAESVPQDAILKILDAANRAPSAMNLQNWSFIVVTGPELAAMGKNFGGIIENLTRNWPPSEKRGEMTREEFVRFAATYGGAPAAVVVLTDSDDRPNHAKAYLESACAAMENMLLAATALGLGTCWMTGPLLDGKFLRDLLAIPAVKEIVAITPVGYPERIPEPPARLDPHLRRNVRWTGGVYDA